MLTSTAPTKINLQDHHWSTFGNCVREDPERMFPGDIPKEIASAKVVCRGNGTTLQPACPVMDRCLADRIKEPYGVVAGMTPDERRALLRRQGARATVKVGR